MDFVLDPFVDSEKYFETSLQQFQFFDKYSRFRYDLGRRETWRETVKRAVDYLREVSENKLSEYDYSEIEQAILNMEVMPSMRLLAMAGAAAKAFPQSIFNCAYQVIDSIEAIVEVLNISMNGIGVGFSVEKQYIDKLPDIVKRDTVYPLEFVIEDSTLGWCEALRVGLYAWFNGNDIRFDYSRIRDAGSVLRTKGGRSSGFQPLKKLLDFARDKILNCNSDRLSSLAVYDIICMISNCVVSGGHRRVAALCLFDYDDNLMLHAKDNDELEINPHRYNCNNSMVLPERELTQKEILQFLMAMDNGNNGEPGIFSRYAAKKNMPARRDENYEFGTNACQPGFATVLTPDGIRTFCDIGVGSVIWSGRTWVNVVNKKLNGIKSVYMYIGNGCVFVGTEDHKILTFDDDNKHIKKDVDSVFNDGNEVYSQMYHDDDDRIEFTDYATLRQKLYIGEFEVYDITVDGIEHMYWTGGLIVSNCGEIVLRPKQFCNLSSVVCRKSDTLRDLERKVRLATIIGTIQSMITDFNGLSPQWRQNCEAERLLGVDLNGQMDCKTVRNIEVQNDLRTYAQVINEYYAALLGITPSAAITTVKPSGNSGVLLNVSSGIHPRWSKYYIRNVRVSKTSPLYRVLLESGVKLSPENGQTGNDATSYVVSFPVKSPDGALTRHDVTALSQLEYWQQVKTNWTEHNVSCSIYYDENEILDVANWLYYNQDIIGGLTFFPKFDMSYAQAPYIEITKDEYEKLLSEFPKIYFSLLQQYEDEDLTTMAQEVACSAGQCDLQL